MSLEIKAVSTKDRILKTAIDLFFEKGYTLTTARNVCERLGISTGNLTFHYPSKEYLLLALVERLCRYQSQLVEAYADTEDLVFKYALEMAAQTSACEDNEVAKDFYVSSYTIPMTLAKIREWEGEYTESVFKKYNPDWTKEDFVLAEITASGIELSILMSVQDEEIAFEDKLRIMLDSLLKLYNVPEKERSDVVDRVLASDYREFGRSFRSHFIDRISNEFETVQ